MNKNRSNIGRRRRRSGRSTKIGGFGHVTKEKGGISVVRGRDSENRTRVGGGNDMRIRAVFFHARERSDGGRGRDTRRISSGK